MGRLGSLEALKGQVEDLEVARLTARRAAMELLRTRADLLRGEDRALVKMYLEAGSSFSQLARLAGKNRSSVCRRIHRLLGRLADGTYPACRRHPHLFDERELAIVRDHFVRGISLARLCRDHQICYYRARRIVEKARRVAHATQTP